MSCGILPSDVTVKTEPKWEVDDTVFRFEECSEYDVKQEPTEVKQEPTEVKEEPTEVKEEPTEVKEEPTEVKEEPAEVKQEPTEVEHEPTEVKQEPAEVKQEPVGWVHVKDMVCEPEVLLWPYENSHQNQQYNNRDKPMYKWKKMEKTTHRAVPYDFNTHQQIHTEKRLFTCNVCGKKYYNRIPFKSHILTHSMTRVLRRIEQPVQYMPYWSSRPWQPRNRGSNSHWNPHDTAARVRQGKSLQHPKPLPTNFDTEKFIREIETRKAIWDLSSEEYRNPALKRRSWEEITNVMCEGNLTENEKTELGKSLLQKWKNIGIHFSNELKHRARGKVVPKPYVYFEQLQFLRKTVIFNETLSSTAKTSCAETNDDIVIINICSPDSEIKKETDIEHLVETLSESIAVSEKRELKQESDPDRLFLLSLLEDFKKIPEHRKISAKMDIIDIINLAKIMLPMETDSSEFDQNVDNEPSISATRQSNYGPETVVSGQDKHGCSTQPNYEPEASSNERCHGHSMSVPDPDRRDPDTKTSEVLSPNDTNVSHTTENSELPDLFQESESVH